MPGSLLNFNIANGGLEATIFGLRDGLLRIEDYGNLSQCDSLEDMKIHLAATDYSTFLQNEAQLSSKVITERALERLVDDFVWLRSNADEELGKFMDFITYEYMIMNVLKIISGARSGRQTMELLYKCHPLGVFEGMGGLTAAGSIDDLYDLVLVDSPIGQFFQHTERRDFDEFSMEYIRSLLHKNYLETFYEFVQTLGGETQEQMTKLLEFEADRFVVTLTRNTYGVKELQKDERMKLFPQVGQLCDVHDDLANIEDDDALKEKLKAFPEFAEMLDCTGGLEDTGMNSLETKFIEKSVELHKDSLSRQFQFGAVYSLMKLRELEVNNIMWISECIIQNMRDRASEYVTIY